MIALKRWSIGLALLVALGLMLAATTPILLHAQGGNLLQDPSFEGPYVGRGRPNLNTPSAWPIWLQDGPHNYDWQNRADKVYAFPHNNGPEVHSGKNSLNINGGYVTFTAAVFQQVSVAPNTNLTGSIWARLKTCNIPKNSTSCGSSSLSGAYVKVGIDPNGGTDPTSGAIVWSGNITPHDTYQQAVVNATSIAGTVTLFAYVTQAMPAQLNNVWFDDASLSVGGAGGTAPGQATAVPTGRPVPTAFVAIVQPPRPDGSIVHTVQPGDTMTGISTAYNVPIDTIVQLNNLRSSRYIFIGQQLLIKPAGSVASTQEAGSPSTTEEAASPLSTADINTLFSQADLASLNTTPGPTPMSLEHYTPSTPPPTLAG